MWIPLVYRDISPNRYIISDDGKIALIDGTILHGCNPKNEKGYIRVTLVTKNNTLKKYALHRLVLAAFTYDSDLEVDHLDCNKGNPALTNLEYVTGDENKHRAALNGRYKSCDSHFKAVLTNDQVHSICRLLESGYNMRKIEHILDLDHIPNIDRIVESIISHKSWKRISDEYHWDRDNVRLKQYTKSDLMSISKLIQDDQYSSKEIASYFPRYKQKQLIQVIKKMRQGKLYKSIMKEARGSTTIADEPRNEDGFIILIRRRKH